LIWVDPFLFDSTFPWFASPARAFSSAPTSIANPVQYSQTIRATLSQGSVGLVEVRKRPEIKAQQVGQSDPATNRKKCPRQGGKKTLFYVGSEKVKSFNGEDC
jgi:hypothetical protein